MGTPATALVGADGLYELRVDGIAVAHGSPVHAPAAAPIDRVDLAPVLARRRGAEVEVELLVLRPIRASGGSAPGPGAGFLLAEVGTGRWSLTDGRWSAGPASYWDLDTPPVNHALGWVEVRRPATGSGAAPAGVVPAAAPRARIEVVERPWARSPWAAPRSATLVRPARLLLAGLAEPRQPAVADLLADARTVPVAPIPFTDLDLSAGPVDVPTRGRDLHLVADLGQVRIGAPYVEVDAPGGDPAVIDLLTGESVDGRGRIESDNAGSIHAHRLTAPCAWRLEPHGARYLHVVVRGTGDRVRVRDLGMTCRALPAPDGAFDCSDQALTRVWEAGVRTLAGAWEDVLTADPAREQRAWLGDLHVALRSARAVWLGPALAEGAAFLARVARGQRADGSLPKFVPGEPPDASTIPAYVLSWVLALVEHARVAPGGAALVRDHRAVVAGALAWFDRWRGADGLVRDVDAWRFVDWTPVRADGTSLHLTALRREVDVALGRTTAPAGPARDAFASPHRAAWRDVADHPGVSQAGNAHAVLAGLLGGDEARAALRDVLGTAVVLELPPTVLRREDGFDPAHDAIAAQPYQAAFLLDALAAAGLVTEGLELIRARWSPLEQRDRTLWEAWSPTGSRCHPWSTGPTAWLTATILGAAHVAPDEVRVRPRPGDLQHAAGALPTAWGPVGVQWERRSGGRLDVEVEVPDGVTVTAGTRRLGAGVHALTLPAV